MHKRLLPLVSGFALALVPLANANDIEPSKEFYTAVRAPAPIVVDGNLSEWAGAPVLADPRFSIPKGSGDSGTLVLFEEYSGGTWSGPDDQTSAVQVVYDDENVYFGFTVTDDYHQSSATSEATAWNGDAVQLMIADAARATQIALYNYGLSGEEGALGEILVNTEAGPGGTEAVIARNATTKKTVYEIKLPRSALGLAALTPGTKFGLGMAINDGDQGGTIPDQTGQKGWGGLGAHALVFGKSPAETALVTLGASEPTIEILGTGTTALLGGDLTDPENDGDELAGPEDPSWNWASITGNNEAAFEGGEFAFNIFDNTVGGGNAKWCCDDPTEAAPLWVSVEFENPVSLTHFTITSGNDARDREPLRFQIQGSNDGQNFTPIFVRDSDVSMWTAVDQVVKVTLPVPAPTYRHIRYFVTHTAGTLHQLGEIEYFGTVGGANLLFISAINPTLDAFRFRATDVGTSIVNPTATKLFIDNQEVSLTASKTGDATDFSYIPTNPLPSGSQHTYLIEVRDTLGNTVASSGEFTTPIYALLTPSEKVTADTSKPGFIWRVHQNNAFTENSISRALQQLAGILGENFADPNAIGIAIAPGTPGANNRLPVEFEIETTINLNQDPFLEQNGDIIPDDQMPGIPGLGLAGQTDGIAAEIVTYIDLPAGRHTLIVNSDDGFRTTAGNINDVFRAQLAGQYDNLAGRGAADTAYAVFVQEAGVYAFRTIYQEGGSGANIEWKMVLEDGTEVLLNDTFNGGFATYRSATGIPTGISSVFPVPGSLTVEGDSPVRIVITEGATAVDLATVQLRVDGNLVTTTPTRDGNEVTVSFQPAGLLPPASEHTASITFTAGGVERTEQWSFTVADYKVLAAANRVTPDTTKPGFIWNVHQNPNANQGANLRALKQLAGLYGHNYVNPDAPGYALAAGTPGADPTMPIKFEIDTVINMDQLSGNNGEFQPDNQMPGIPSLSATPIGTPTGDTDGIAAEILTYIDLPAGKNTLIFNSDDGFRAFAGNSRDVFDATVLAEFDAGRGAADTVYSFFVEQAGVYPFRTVWFEGGGGANLEWKIQKADGTRALINDTASGGAAAYRAATAGTPTAITRISPWMGYGRVSVGEPIEVVIEEGATTVADASIQLSLNNVALTPTVSRSGKIITVRAQPALPAGTNIAKITFTHGGTARSEEWGFGVPETIEDEIGNYPGMILGSAAFTADQGGRTGQAGDFAMNFGTGGTVAPGLLVSDSELLDELNSSVEDDTMTVSLWVKKINNADSSAFWFDSPRSLSSMRGFQAHIPWSNGNIYFDSAGCCDAESTRIDAPIANHVEFTDMTWWTDEWHHWAFVKSPGFKEIYIDGTLFHSGGGDALFPDFERLWIGAAGGGPDGGSGSYPGFIDDFAIFGAALTEAQIDQLVGGTLPSALGAAAEPIAHWNFNSVPVVVEEPVITLNRAGADLTITWTNGGTLQGSPVVTGPTANWQDLDSDGSYSTTTAGSTMYFRVFRP